MQHSYKKIKSCTYSSIHTGMIPVYVCPPFKRKKQDWQAIMLRWTDREPIKIFHQILRARLIVYNRQKTEDLAIFQN